MTMLDDRPITGATPAPPPLRDRGLLAPWRLAARLARRETRRRPGRTILAALLIAVPVFAMTIGSVLVRTDDAASSWPGPFQLQWPGADAAFTTDARTLPAVVDAAAQVDGARVISFLSMASQFTPADGEGSIYTSFTDMPLDDPMIRGSIDIRSGSVPRPGQVLLTPFLADHFDVEVGDELILERPSGTWTVSGIGRPRWSHGTDMVVFGEFDHSRVTEDQFLLTTLVDVPVGADLGPLRANAVELGGLTPLDAPYFSEDSTSTLAWGWVGGVLALVAVGIIVAAAFATSARRQLVTVGQLAANGATQGVIRRSLVLQGTWTAAVGVCIGMAVGLMSLPFVRGIVQNWVLDRDMLGYRIAATDLVAIALTGLVAGSVAAAVPARSLSKVPVMAALSGRRPLGAPRRWLVPTGVVLTLGGLGLLSLAGLGARNTSSNGGSTDMFALAIIVATVAVVFGMVCATLLVIDRVGRIAGHLPLSPRLALRSTARSRTRSSAVVAAIAVTVGGATAAGMVADHEIVDAYTDQRYLPDDTVVINFFDQFAFTGSDAVVDLDPPTSRPLTAAEQERLDAAFPRASFAPLLVAGFDPPPFRENSSEESWSSGIGPMIATPALLDVLGLSARDRSTLQREGSIYITDPSGADGGVTSIRLPVGGSVVTLESPLTQDVVTWLFGAYTTLLTESHARELGLDVVERGVVVRADAPLDDDQRSLVSNMFNGGIELYDAFVEPGDPPRPGTEGAAAETMDYAVASYDSPYVSNNDRDRWIARAVIVGLAVLLTLTVVSIGLSLAAAEGRQERDTLTIVGATPRSRRRQAATNAWLLAFLGVALGIPTGFLPTTVLWQAINVDGWMPFPWVTVAIVAIGVPLAAAGAAWLGSAVSQHIRPATLARRD